MKLKLKKKKLQQINKPREMQKFKKKDFKMQIKTLKKKLSEKINKISKIPKILSNKKKENKNKEMLLIKKQNSLKCSLCSREKEEKVRDL